MKYRENRNLHKMYESILNYDTYLNPISNSEYMVANMRDYFLCPIPISYARNGIRAKYTHGM